VHLPNRSVYIQQTKGLCEKDRMTIRKAERLVFPHYPSVAANIPAKISNNTAVHTGILTLQSIFARLHRRINARTCTQIIEYQQQKTSRVAESSPICLLESLLLGGGKARAPERKTNGKIDCMCQRWREWHKRRNLPVCLKSLHLCFNISFGAVD
jgi:hypothetical protein